MILSKFSRTTTVDSGTYRKNVLCLTDTQAIYTVGCNEEGQLGTGDTEPHTVPQYVEIDCEETQIKQVSAGSNHSAILTG